MRCMKSSGVVDSRSLGGLDTRGVQLAVPAKGVGCMREAIDDSTQSTWKVSDQTHSCLENPPQLRFWRAGYDSARGVTSDVGRGREPAGDDDSPANRGQLEGGHVRQRVRGSVLRRQRRQIDVKFVVVHTDPRRKTLQKT